MKINKYLSLIIISFLILNCSGDESSALIPEKALLISPAEDSPCLTGDSVSDTEIEVIFKWSVWLFLVADSSPRQRPEPESTRENQVEKPESTPRIHHRIHLVPRVAI